MNTDNPIISVIVPCYNSEEYLAETLNSVLAQTCIDWECIIVNDGSTDDSLRIAQEYVEKDKRFKVIDKKNEGPAIARNVGITNASGKYILPLDSDDKIAPTYLEKACSYLEKHPETKLVYCRGAYFGEMSGEWIQPQYKYEEMLWRNCIFCSAIYRRTDFDKTIGYNPNMVYGEEDWDFWLSFLSPNDIVYKIPEILFYYRRHGVSRNVFVVERIDESHSQIVLNHLSLYKPYLSGLMKWKSERDFYKKELEKILQSKSYKLGRALLLPFRWIKDALKRDDM